MNIELAADKIQTIKNILIGRLCLNCNQRGICIDTRINKFSCQFLARKTIQNAGFDPDDILISPNSCGDWHLDEFNYDETLTRK
jgi:hypothetical protein